MGRRTSSSLRVDVAQRLAILALLALVLGGVGLFTLQRMASETKRLAQEVRTENVAFVELGKGLSEMQDLVGQLLSPIAPSAERIEAAAQQVDQRIAAIEVDEAEEESILSAMEAQWETAREALPGLLADGPTSTAGFRFFPAVSGARRNLVDLQRVALDETVEEFALVRDRQRVVSRVMLVLCGLAPLGAAAAGWTFHRRVSRPLRELLTAAEQLGEHRPPQPLGALEPEEFGRLGAAFNAMAERIAAARASLEHRAFHDELTGLPNRALLQDRLEVALARSSRAGHTVAIAVIDLDNFKNVNDRAGHGAGDAYLIEVGRRLRTAVRAEDTVARLGGDEFAAILEGAAAKEAGECCERILQALAASILVSGRPVTPTASIGVVLREPGDQRGTSSLLRDADIAMYVAKAQGRATWRVFEEWMRQERTDDIDLATDLSDAIDARQLHVELQPIVGLDDVHWVALEALARWTHPVRGAQSPSNFIPAAENAGLMHRLGDFVLEAAVAALRQLDDEQLGIMSVSVNVSAVELDDPTYPERVLHHLESAGIDASRLTLEVTESTIMEATVDATDGLRALRSKGVRIAIDDFGVGHSSLSRLNQLPFDEIKLDGSFVRQRSTHIIEAVAAMAQRLGLTLVMEGLESADDLQLAQQVACPLAQGFFISQPLAPHEVAPWLRDWKRRR